MKKGVLFLLLIFVNTFFAQQSDFKKIDFTRADNIGKSYNSKNLLKLHKFTKKLTSNLNTDIEKLRAIYIWITHNVANDYRLYNLNDRKIRRFQKDSIRLDKWNSRFKKILFKKLLKRKRTICTGYAYLLKEMCNIVDIEAKIVNGIGRTSDMDFDKLVYPNHSWSLVKINNKWYLCDPTWSSGISLPDENKFVFNYSDGYFLADPKVFIKNHYPINPSFSLLGDKTPTYETFTEMPILYNKAFEIFQDHIIPKKMYHEIKQNDTFTFQYKLDKEIDVKKLKFVLTNNAVERTVKPKITLENNLLTLKQTFKKRGFYDVHLYLNKEIVATYTFKISK